MISKRIYNIILGEHGLDFRPISLNLIMRTYCIVTIRDSQYLPFRLIILFPTFERYYDSILDVHGTYVLLNIPTHTLYKHYNYQVRTHYVRILYFILILQVTA